MTNFDFLIKEKMFEDFSETFVEAENSLRVNNVITAILSRRAIELAIKWMYANDNDLERPFQDNLSTLIHNSDFINIIDSDLFMQLNYIVKLGNLAVHNNRKISRQEVILALNYLFNFAKWLDYSYGQDYEEVEFDEKILEYSFKEVATVKERKTLFDEFSKGDKSIGEFRNTDDNTKQKITKQREDSQGNITYSLHGITEAETRKIFIDVALKESGWIFNENVLEEYEVEGMPNNAGVGRADYVLLGRDGSILAVVEAKRVDRDIAIAKEQAKLYADCLEKLNLNIHNKIQRPIIFYTNGLEIMMWDDVNYPPRKISGYYTQGELESLMNRRRNRESILNPFINEEITNRVYQQEAIKSVCEAFEQNKSRKALLVMATGTGKTRTAISLVDVLTSKSWVKNILFLADRNVLVNQAENNFNKLLPNISHCNLSKGTGEPEDARIVFSTYQTMINKIDETKTKDNQKLFTPGHFDLIIVDEAHRSIYNKYKVIFEYFDSLLVGLTATPKSDIDMNTYSSFDLENNNPTFAYEMQEAVDQKYLVNYKAVKVMTDFTMEGIRYNALSVEEREKYENIFEDEEEFRDEIGANEIDNWLFNKDTIRKYLKFLMEHGIKVEGGDKLGKTIIFAKNHNHAVLIEKIFNELYPHYAGKFAQIIDNQIKYNEQILADFSKVDSYPQIAISVDMLDTGVDVPEVVNLVFYKPVRSKIKFSQMIGRGTRLCKDLFGANKNKEYFYIFDICNNFEFFEQHPDGIEATKTESITEKIFKNKLELIVELQNINYQNNKEYIEYRESLVNEFLNEIANLNPDGFIVKVEKAYILKFNNKEQWNDITQLKSDEIKKHLIPLFIIKEKDEFAKLFDRLCLNLEEKKIKNKSFTVEKNNLINIANEISKKGTLPQVLNKEKYIKDALDESFIDNANILDIEVIRENLRELVKFIDFKKKKIIETDIEDNIVEVVDIEPLIIPALGGDTYEKRVNNYLGSNKESIVIKKIRENKNLTAQEYEELKRILFEELGSEKDYVEVYGEKNIMETIRSLVGLDREVAEREFFKFINEYNLNSTQIRFVKILIDYISENGVMELGEFMQEPFKSVGNLSEVFKDKINVFNEIRDKVIYINENAKRLA